MNRKRVVVAGLGDVGILIAVRLARHADVVGISVKPGLVSGQELGVRLSRPDDWARDYWIPFDRFRRLDRIRKVRPPSQAWIWRPGPSWAAATMARRSRSRTTRWSSRRASPTVSGAARPCSRPPRSARTCTPRTPGWPRPARWSSWVAARRRSAAPPTWQRPGRTSGLISTSPEIAPWRPITRGFGNA